MHVEEVSSDVCDREWKGYVHITSTYMKTGSLEAAMGGGAAGRADRGSGYTVSTVLRRAPGADAADSDPDSRPQVCG